MRCFLTSAWSELLLIGVVALVVIGPKDLPKALRVAGFWVKKARTLSREFQSSVEQMIREAELDEMRQELKKATEIDHRQGIPEDDRSDRQPRREPEAAGAAEILRRRPCRAAPRPPSSRPSRRPPQPPAPADRAAGRAGAAGLPGTIAAPRRGAHEPAPVQDRRYRRADDDSEAELEEGRMPLLDHLIELRNRLMWAIGAVMVAFLICYQFKERIYGFLVHPLAVIFEGQTGRH